MKVELTALAGQRETCHEEKKRADIDVEFSSWFSVLVITCLSAGFVFAGERLMLGPFSEPTSKIGLVNFRLFLHRDKSSTHCLYPLTSFSLLCQTESSPYFRLVSEREPYLFPVFPYLCRRFRGSGRV